MLPIILDNIIFSIQKSGGISVVWQKNILALRESLVDNVCCIEYINANENISRKSINIDYIEKRNFRFLFKLERYLNPSIRRDKPFIFHSSYYRTCCNKNAINITTVHDFTYEIFNSGFSKWLHCWQKYRAIKRSDFIVCVTENTKRDLIKFLPNIDTRKIRIIYNGVSSIYHPLLIKPKDYLGKYLLFVGWRVTYKNFKLTVDSIRNLDYRLVIVGAPLSNKERKYLDRFLGKNRYHSFVRISDEELNELYNSAYCLCYPSEYEGFGIPVLEAQRAGCPVIAYNASSIPEIIGKTPLLLMSSSISEFQEKLKILEDKSVREEIIVNGFKNSMRFSWEKMGQDYLKLYREISLHNA